MNELILTYLPAVITAGVLSFFVGFVWYTFLFGKPWMRALGINIEDVESSGLSARRAIVASLFASIATAGGLAVIFIWMGTSSIPAGLAIGITVWIAFSLTPMFKMIFWEDRRATLVAIDGGYELASILVAVLVLLLWP